MQYFIGVVPPEEYQQRVIRFQKQWSSNRLPEVVEPHVTIKAQGGLTTDLKWMERVQAACSSFPTFELTLSKPESFGRTVLYLSVVSKEFMNMHRRLVHAVSPSPELIECYFELDRFTPHLTLGQTYWGMSESELDQMKSKVAEALSPFLTFPVTYVRVYEEYERDKYRPCADLPLAQRG